MVTFLVKSLEPRRAIGRPSGKTGVILDSALVIEDILVDKQAID